MSNEEILKVYNKTLACILSLSAINTAVPLPALAMPFTSAVEAPEPIPNEKHLRWIHVCKKYNLLSYLSTLNGNNSFLPPGLPAVYCSLLHQLKQILVVCSHHQQWVAG